MLSPFEAQIILTELESRAKRVRKVKKALRKYQKALGSLSRARNRP